MRIVLQESSDRKNGKINYSSIMEAVEKESNQGDFWILPEAFDTGWNVTKKTKFPSMENLIFFHQLSQKHKISVCGSFYVEKDGFFFNRFAVVTKDGKEYFTEKRHLFGEFEKNFCKIGKEEPFEFQIDDIIFRVAVCYDLRFPVWCRQKNAKNPFDVLLCVSQWPLVRDFDRNLLLATRALENVSYTVNCNALGGSKVFFADGKEHLYIPDNEQLAFFELDKEKLTRYREYKKYLSDADNFQIL